MTAETRNSPEIPDVYYPNSPLLITPDRPTPKHSLYLSNLDDQKFLRFSIKYLYLFEKAVSVETLKASLSRVLSEYYPLAGRLKAASFDADGDNDQKLQVECNDEGAVFAEAFIDLSAQEFLEFSAKPNSSWRKLLYKVDAHSFLDVPPLVVQVTNLCCGGMILCMAINHCLCDGIGTSQFLNAWAYITSNPNSDLSITPLHSRHVLRPRSPPQVSFTHPVFYKLAPHLGENGHLSINKYLQSQPLVATSFTFNPSQILNLKRQLVPSLKCTTFEALASHTWKAWVRSLNLSYFLKVKLLFSVDIRKKLKPEIPQGYYGNGFVLGCAEATVKDLITNNLGHGVKLVQQAKSCLNDDYIRSMIDMLEDKKSLIREFQVEFIQKSARVKSLDLHPLQPWILVGLYSGNVEVWNYQSKKLEKSFEVSSNVPVRSAKFVARKGWIVTGSDDKFIRVYDYNTEEKIKEFEAHEDYIRCIVVHPTLPHVLSASDDKHIKLWDWEKEWICAQTFVGHSHYVMQVAFHPIDHTNFASVSLDCSIKIWNLGNSNPVTTIDAHEKGVNCVNYFTNEGKLYLLTGSDDYTTKVWDYQSLSCNKVLEGHTNNVTTILTHPELPNLILTGSEDKNVYVWDAATSKLEMTLDQGLGRVWTIEFEKTTSKLIIGCDEGFLIGKIVGA